jgi:transglutaminase-like putative cysteine protease
MYSRGATLEQSIHRYFELSLFAMIAVAFIALAGTGRLDLLSLAIVLPALGFRAYLFALHRPWSLSVQATSNLTVAYIVFYIADLFLVSRSFVPTLVHMVLFILVVKMFSIQRERDYIYLAIISFMMVLAAAILTVDSFFLGAFLVFMLLSICTFISMEMRRSLREVNRINTKTPASPNAVTHGAVGWVDSASTTPGHMRKSLSYTAAVLVVSIFAGAPLIFYGLPRWSFQRFTQFAVQNAFVSGFSDSVKLGEIGRIQQSDLLVMHVQFKSGGAQIPADLKWMGVTLAQFDGTRWTNPHALMRSYVRPASFDNLLDLRDAVATNAYAGIPVIPPPRPDQVLEYRVRMEPIGTNTFFVLSMPLAIQSDSRSYMVNPSASIAYSDPLRQIRIYQARSYLRPGVQAEDAGLPQSIQLYLQLPKLDPRVPALAQKVTANATTPHDKAAAIEQYLRANFGYTLEMDSAGPDPLAHFLFARKKGHCEYFASSMAVMLRTIGIPSRIVNGFRGGELNDLTGSYIVRAKDAHSWVEAYIPGHGWTAFDPTPASAVNSAGFWSRTSLYIDAMREFWAEWVINYDTDRQTALTVSTISRTRMFFDKLRVAIRDKYDTILEGIRKTQDDALKDPKMMGGKLLVLLGSVFALWNVRRVWRWLLRIRIAARPASAPKQAASIWYERMLKLLRRRGIERAPGQTPDELLHQFPSQLPVVKEKVIIFTEHYERARFNQSAPDAEKLPELYDEVEEALKR